LDECFNGRDAQYETWGEFAVGRRYILCKLTPIYSDQGGIVGAVSNLNDITESLKNKELLRLERERFFLMLESIPAFVYLLDSGHKIVYCNENFNETFDLKKTCICSQGAQDEKCKAFNIFNTRENRRWEWTSSAGKTYILQGTYLPEIDGNPMVLILGVDITDRKIIESQLIDAKNVAESANRSKSEFLANMSHEIRTPMNAVLGMTELVLESELNDEQRELLDMVMESGDALLSVINEILDFSRIEKNNCPLRLKDFILPGLLESVIRSFRVTADAKGLKLEYNASPGLPFNVKGDADKLRQILVNLIGNALKFTESGKVVLNVNWESECNDFFTLRFSVEDTGIGIPEEKSASIFDAFIQVDGSSTRSYGGTGLGLAISSRLVSLMGGKIWLESKLGEGSKFHFTVQLEKSQETFNYENVEDKILNLRDLKSAYGAGKILIAEDDLTCRKIIVQQLQSSGYDVVVAENGRDAVEFFKKEKFEAVFMDIQMPEMDGYEAVEEIRDYEHKNGKKKITPVIAITAHAMENERDKCFAAGMNDFISKPAKKSEILLKLSSLLKDNT
jgi:signal transduction histidine kinase/ActR/RegA family two-component response regulator